MNDPARLYTALLNTGLQIKDNPLYQVIHNLIGFITQQQTILAPIASGSSSFVGPQGVQGIQGIPGNIINDDNIEDQLITQILSSSIYPLDGRISGAIAAIASLVTFTVGALDGTFRVSGNVNVTVATLHSFSVLCSYTDETNTPRVLTLPFVQLGGVTLVGTITNVTGSGPYEGVTLTIRAKAGTSITISTSGTFTTVTYNAEGLIEKVA